MATQALSDNFVKMFEDMLIETENVLKAEMVRNWPEGKKSDLYKSVDTYIKKGSNGFSVEYVMNDYYKYVGAKIQRRKGAKKIPIRVVLQMIKKYNIRPRGNQTVNSLAFAIQTAIYKNGIIGKNFTTRMLNAGEKYILKYDLSDDLVQEILKSIEKSLDVR